MGVADYVLARTKANGRSVGIYYLQKHPPRGVPRKSVPKICSKVTGERPCRSAVSMKLVCNFSEITLRRGCSPVNMLHIFRTPFLNTSEWLFLYLTDQQKFALSSKR